MHCRLPHALLLCAVLLAGCWTPFEARHEGSWNPDDQVWRADLSQVRVRAAQSRVFETSDRVAVLAATIGTLQDLDFVIDVADEHLGVVSAHKHLPLEGGEVVSDPTYSLHDPDGLLVFENVWRTWGPFDHRCDILRATVTVRPRGRSEVVVRISAQHYLRAVEDAEPYQGFFAALQRSLSIDALQVQPDQN
ncbi:MAG: hypothetical protein IPM29_17455 [Planctomycetes bacterium]|nr:hypothetical protein [Planctomycetota bacterium]